MNKRLISFTLALAMTLAVPMSAWAQTLNEAANQAARQNDAKVLSAKTVKEGDRQVHVIKLLTRDGVVKTVRIQVKKR
jgi:hypothetical protein